MHVYGNYKNYKRPFCEGILAIVNGPYDSCPRIKNIIMIRNEIFSKN
jgi:hypothetical protein